jgi:putative tricarboxylic transport membrane protein
MEILGYVWSGVLAVFQGPALFHIFGIAVPVTLVMVFSGLLTGILVGSTPGLAGPMAMAVSLPILISVFGYHESALLPVMGFLIGVMKGATIGGAVPAILFNTPGTPDAYLTTFDGYPMTKKGQSGKALRVAHLSSVSGDTVSDLVLFTCAPFLAILVEAYLDLPEKTAMIILSLSFIAAVVGKSVAKGLMSMALGMLTAYIGTGEDFYPRLTGGVESLSAGFSMGTVILGVLIVGEVFKSMEDLWLEHGSRKVRAIEPHEDNRLHWSDIRKLMPYIRNSALIGTLIGALPGIGTTLAATLGYATGKKLYERRKSDDDPEFGEGVPQGVAATEAANSAVSGANLIPVLSLGIPGNAAAVFLILAADSIGGFNPGPSVFKFTTNSVNPELVIAFGLFTMMVFANFLNWTIGGVFMRSMGVMARVPKHIIMPIVLLLTLTAIYVEETNMGALLYTLGFGILGYLFRRLGISPLPFVIAFILAGKLEETARQAFSSTGGNVWFLFSSVTSTVFMLLTVVVIIGFTHSKKNK